MTMPRFTGVLAPVVTAFDENLRPDATRLLQHCRWLLGQGVSLAVFGTNSEANSLSVHEKLDLLAKLIDAGIEPRHLLPGCGSCALPDTIMMARHAVSMGCGGILVLPPFYYKPVSDDGLFAFYAKLIEEVADERLSLYLYHIPQLTGVPLSLALIERLLQRFPHQVAGIKDSSGDWQFTESLLQQGWDDFRVFCGSESFLLATCMAGGAGCISATANVNPGALTNLYENSKSSDAAALQRQADQVRQIFQRFPMIAALKQTLAHNRDDSNWQRVRPPLVPLDEQQTQDLQAALQEISFTMPDLEEFCS